MDQSAQAPATKKNQEVTGNIYIFHATGHTTTWSLEIWKLSQNLQRLFNSQSKSQNILKTITHHFPLTCHTHTPPASALVVKFTTSAQYHLPTKYHSKVRWMTYA